MEDKKMFCYQCEQTAGGKGCTKAGVCGKSPEVALAQDRLTEALVDLAIARGDRAADAIDELLIDGLFATLTNVNFDKEAIEALTQRARALAPPTGFALQSVWEAQEDIASLKSLALFGVRGIAAYAYHARQLGCDVTQTVSFAASALAALAEPGVGMEDMLGIVMGCGKANYEVMAALDRANTDAFGKPAPTAVELSVEAGPFIIISGHDLLDLKKLLEQTEGKGVNVYTHGEMLPAHAYPELKKYPQLKGNFGTAWQNQQKEFAGVPAPILFTTNCLMPPKDSYADRVFTTGVVAYPALKRIGEDKDFSEVIAKAIELGGYPAKREMTGINGGTHLTTGFGHDAVLGVADTVIEAVKSGAIKHFFLVGGCDGAKPGRNYYTEFVQSAPADTVILTLACGKYRFNDLQIGQIGALPRIMDMGQCNDAYSAIQVALALAGAFGCEVNELPLTLVLSWYEQKAVSILLTLLYLGIKNILLGPSLPAFVSPGVLEYLVENFAIAPTSTPAADLEKVLGALA